MTSLIGAGIGARRRATQGFGAVAQMEAAENRNQMMIDQAREAQKMQTLGTGAGFGAMYGMSKLPAATAAPVGEAVKVGAVEAAKLGDASLLLTEGKLAAVAEGAGAAAGAGAGGGAVGGAAAGTTGAAAGGGAAAGTTGAAAGSAGTLSTIATLAAPIAIGLGAAYLITKLFD